MAFRYRVFAGTMTAVIPLLAACAGEPTLQVEWTGADTGRADLAVSASRCGGGPVEMLAVSGDTGIGIVIHGPVPLAIQDYPVAYPSGTDGTEPGASVAARWLDSAAVVGYRGREGTVTLEENGVLSGRFSVEAVEFRASRSVTLTGEFSGITVGPCTTDSTADSMPEPGLD